MKTRNRCKNSRKSVRNTLEAGTYWPKSFAIFRRMTPFIFRRWVNLFRSILCFCIIVIFQTQASVVSFNEWTIGYDPFDADFSGTASADQATLLAASGEITAGTDIAYFSVNGATVESSSSGYGFSPSSSFSIAIDYDLSFSSANGVLGIGFGIGEGTSGDHSAGVGMLTYNGFPTSTFTAVGRVDGVNQSFSGNPPGSLGLAAALSGSLFVSYDAGSGDVTVGASHTKGASTASHTFTMSGIQNDWNEADLLASFFLRSESIPGVASGWSSGTADAVFSNFRVQEGTPTVVPEPSDYVWVMLGCMGLFGLGHRLKRI